MAIQAAAGAALMVSTTKPTAYTKAGYETVLATATNVGEVTNIGEFGKEFALVTSTALAQRGTRKLKGSFNNGTLNPTINLDLSDAGQVIMEDLLESDDPGTFFVILPDGDGYGLEGLVMTFRPSVGEIDSVITATCTIEVTHNNVVKVETP